MTYLIALAIYFAIPLIATLIAGRCYTWKGQVFFFLLWPIAWMFMQEELP